LPGKAFYRGTQQYAESHNSYFAAFENEASTGCIVEPNGAEDVTKTVKAMKASNVRLAIRGGGYTLWAGAANIEDGVTIDMRVSLESTYMKTESLYP
ncbi:hypothetical protein K469DRAFT_555847, partial [Zopfia rhizophila CBS 207.26]